MSIPYQMADYADEDDPPVTLAQSTLWWLWVGAKRWMASKDSEKFAKDTFGRNALGRWRECIALGERALHDANGE